MQATSHMLDADSKDDESMAERTPPPLEPSMEEILASIRKIISDEDKPAHEVKPAALEKSTGENGTLESDLEDSQNAPVDTSFDDLEALVSSGLTRVTGQELPEMVEEQHIEDNPPVEEALDESVEDLRALKRSMASASIEQQLEQQASNNDIIFKDDSVEDPEESSPEPDPEPQDPGSDVFDLTQKINDDGSITDMFKTKDAIGAGTSSFDAADTAAHRANEMVKVAESAPDDLLDEGYEIDDDTSDEDLIAGDALELVMVRTLRPMLKQWIDENLPPIVERMVKEELRRRPK